MRPYQEFEANVFPAHAGMTRHHRTPEVIWDSVPRPRGDDQDAIYDIQLRDQCSPPTRG